MDLTFHVPILSLLFELFVGFPEYCLPRRSVWETILTPEYLTFEESILNNTNHPSVTFFLEIPLGSVMGWFPVAFPILMPLVLLDSSAFEGHFATLRTTECPALYPLIRPHKRPLALGRGLTSYSGSHSVVISSLVRNRLYHVKVRFDI